MLYNRGAVSRPNILTSDHGPGSDEYLCLWTFGLIINDRGLVVAVCDGCDMQGRGPGISAVISAALWASRYVKCDVMITIREGGAEKATRHTRQHREGG